MPDKKITEAQAEQALRAHYGNVSAAAKALKVAHPTLWNRLKRSERLRKAKEEAEEQTLDLAEDGLVSAVRDREAWAICFLLKTRGKKRGYIEKQEQSVQLSGEADFLAALRGSGRMVQE